MGQTNSADVWSVIENCSPYARGSDLARKKSDPGDKGDDDGVALQNLAEEAAQGRAD